jgi:uncharacterized membrane protein
MGSRGRLVLASVAGLPVLVAASLLGPWQLAAMMGWVAAGVVYLLAAWWVIARTDASATEHLATREDNGRGATGVILVVASLGSLITVVAGLVHDKGSVRVTTVFALVTVVVSWFVVQTVFTLRYAHLYYTEPTGGIDFPGEEDPDYGDFAYVALTVGVAFQVSDTAFSQRSLRRTLTRHGLLAYLFGTIIIGVTINVVGNIVS